MAPKKKSEPEEATDTPEAAPETATATEPATDQAEETQETEADRRAARRAKRGPREEKIPNIWVRYNQQSGMAAGPHTFGPFPTRNAPSRRITLTPGETQEVDGYWGASLKASSISFMFDFFDKPPK